MDAGKFLDDLYGDMPSTLDAKPSLVAGESRPKEKRTDQNEDHHNEHRKRKREEGEVVPLHLRPRKLNFWDQKPENYESMTAAQVKATGMFLLPSHLLKGTGSFGHPSFVGPYQGQAMGLIGFGNHDHSTGGAGFHTKRLYISGTSGLDCTDKEFGQWVTSLFEERGIPKDPGNPVEHVLMHDKGFAFVDLRSAHETTAALAIGTADFMGRPLRFSRPKDYRSPEEDSAGVANGLSNMVQDSPNKIFVGGIPEYATDDQIMELLKAFGELKAFSLVRHPETGKSKGFAFCEYVNPDITDLACEGLNGLQVLDKKLIVQRAHVGGTASRLPMIEGALPGAGTGKPILPIEILGTSGLKPAEPTTVLMLLNLCDYNDLRNDDRDQPGSGRGDILAQEMHEDILREVERFGAVNEVFLPMPGAKHDPIVRGVGRAYCKFEDKEECAKAQRALAGRKFNGRTVCTTFFDEDLFEKRLFG